MSMKTKAEAQKIRLDKIRTDGGTQPRAELNQVVIDDYAQAMKAGSEFPPVVVFYDGNDYWLADGFHRHGAKRSIKAGSILAQVHQGDRRAAMLWSFSANHTHGQPRTNADKRRAASLTWTDSEIEAWSCGERVVNEDGETAFISLSLFWLKASGIVLHSEGIPESFWKHNIRFLGDRGVKAVEVSVPDRIEALRRKVSFGDPGTAAAALCRALGDLLSSQDGTT